MCCGFNSGTIFANGQQVVRQLEMAAINLWAGVCGRCQGCGRHAQACGVCAGLAGMLGVHSKWQPCLVDAAGGWKYGGCVPRRRGLARAPPKQMRKRMQCRRPLRHALELGRPLHVDGR